MIWGITLVPHGRISFLLPVLLENLAKSELWTKGRATIDDILTFLYTGQMNLWAIYSEDGKVHAFIITEIKQYPRCKMLISPYTAGDYGVIDAAEDITLTTLEQFAKDTGCSGIEAIGRIGWKSRAKKHGFLAATMVYEKYFEVKS